MLHGSGLSDSQYMKCQKTFRSHQKVYNDYIGNIKHNKAKKRKGWLKWFIGLIKRIFK